MTQSRTATMAAAGCWFATIVAAASPALAHAQLRHAMPPVGSVLHAAPASLSLDFSESIEPAFSSVVVQDGSGARVDQDDLHVAPGHPAELVIGLRPMTAGTFRVIWHVTSTDTHKTEGAFQFTVAP